MISFTHSEPPLTQHSQPNVLFIHSSTLLLLCLILLPLTSKWTCHVNARTTFTNIVFVFSYPLPGQQVVSKWKWWSSFQQLSPYISRQWRSDRNSCTVRFRVGFEYKLSLYIIREWRSDRNGCTLKFRVGFEYQLSLYIIRQWRSDRNSCTVRFRVEFEYKLTKRNTSDKVISVQKRLKIH